ncbi:phosphate/phosphite/phosphonate ABC transporter substrate-binding protein [Desulforegula conservatrix]|uniref:phosphate/phosphite/phosphonate ABC transporter substrate-binding protein n=1 Tax=Desulforegula conservatrix TaxID=153026 RepID=UPI0003FFC330|nr:phosphate/phosphite/phosphonate ABC transporter substrate-binding protein [Desulforegula conservatrix]
MKILMIKFIWLSAAIFIILALVVPDNLKAEDTYRFSMMPQFYPERIARMTEPLVKYLEKGCSRKITPVMTMNNSDYEASIRKGDVEIAYQNPMIYNSISDVHEAVVVGVSPDGGDKYRGLVIVPSNSPVTALSELKGKTVMIVGKNTGGGYFSPKISLLDAGVDIEKDVELVTAADNKQENVIIAVSLGDVDAGFIRESAFHAADAFIKPDSVRILAPCAWLPGWALSVKRSLPQTEKTRIKNLLINLPSDSPVIKALDLKGFREADDSVYAPLKKLLIQPDTKPVKKN